MGWYCSTAIQGSRIAQTSFISGIAITMTTGNFTNVNVSGTITYEDLTRLDSLLVSLHLGVVLRSIQGQVLHNYF